MADFVSIISNLESSIAPVQRLITGGAYLAGITLIFKGLYELKQFGSQRASRRFSHGASAYPSMIYLLCGSMFLFLPSTLGTFMATVFGYDTPLAYGTLSEFMTAEFGDTAHIVMRLIQTVGVLWMALGIGMITKSTEPGRQGGAIGAAYIFGGLLAFNVQGTANMLSETARFIATNAYNLDVPSFLNISSY